MELNIAEKFIFLNQHPEKDYLIATAPGRNIGFFGAVLMDLAAWEKVKIENDYLYPTDKEGLLNQPHDLVVSELRNARKPRKTKYWLSRFSNKYSRSIKTIIQNLEEKRKLQIINKKFLFIKYYRTRLVDFAGREQLINKLKNSALYGSNIDQETVSLLGLIQACQLHKILFKDRSERKIGKSKIKQIVENSEIAGDVGKVIQDMNAAIIVATTAASVSVSSSS